MRAKGPSRSLLQSQLLPAASLAPPHLPRDSTAWSGQYTAPGTQQVPDAHALVHSQCSTARFMLIQNLCLERKMQSILQLGVCRKLCKQSTQMLRCVLCPKRVVNQVKMRETASRKDKEMSAVTGRCSSRRHGTAP